MPHRSTSISILAFASLVSTCFLVSFSGCNSDTSKSVRAATPEAAFEQFCRATKAKNYQAMAALLTPDTLNDMASEMLGQATLLNKLSRMPVNTLETAKLKASAAKVMQLLKQYGLNQQLLENIDPLAEDDGLTAALDSITDKPGFVSSMMGLMDLHMPDAESPIPMIEESSIKGIEISEQTATGTATLDGYTCTWNFKQIDGSWCIDHPEF